MRFDKDKFFGYPVLRPLLEGERSEDMDFIDSVFEATFMIKPSLENRTKLEIGYLMEHSISGFEKLLKNKALAYMLDVRCKKTFYSQKFEVDADGKIDLDLTKLRDVVEVCPFIIAKKKTKISSDKIHPDFGYSKYTVERDAVVAWHPAVAFSVEREQYASVKSIITYKKSAKYEFGDYVVDMDEDYVSVIGQPQFIDNCKTAELANDTQLQILGVFFIPVLSQMLWHMAENPAEVDEKRWSSVLKAKCLQLDIDWENNDNIPENAQKILGYPLRRISQKEFRIND